MNKIRNIFGEFFMKPGLMALLAMTVVVGLAFMGCSSDDGSDGSKSVFSVERGPLRISVTESGTIKAKEQVIIKNELEGETTILWLVPEGNSVKKGELLVELDATKLANERIDQQIAYDSAEAASIHASESFEVAKNQALSDKEKAVLTLDFAQQDLEKYVKGEYPNLLDKAEVEIKQADLEVERARDKYNASVKLAEKKYISQNELKTNRLAFTKAELNLQVAKGDKDLLRDYTYKRQFEELKSNVSQADMALERTNRKADADVLQAEAEKKAAGSKFQQEKSKLDKIIDQISKAKIYAPTDGMVIYATSTKHSWRGSDEPLEEGRGVREREELIHLPMTDSVKVEVSVHETSINKIKVGLPVIVQVDSVPDKTFTGTVAKIAIMPNAQLIWMNPDLKVYTTEIYIDGKTSELRTGMSCKAEIIIEDFEDEVYVPVQSVVRVGDQPTVYVVKGKKQKPRPVEIGLDNNRMVQILSGLKVGEKVSLTPPLAPSEVKSRGQVKPGGSEAIRPEGQRRPAGVEGQRRPTGPGGQRRPTGAGGQRRPSGSGGRPAGPNRRGNASSDNRKS